MHLSARYGSLLLLFFFILLARGELVHAEMDNDASSIGSKYRGRSSRRALHAEPHHLHVLVKAPAPLSKTDTSKSLLHISRHGGNLRDMFSISGLLGLRNEVVHVVWPMDISKSYADDDWAKNRDYYNAFDMIFVK